MNLCISHNSLSNSWWLGMSVSMSISRDMSTWISRTQGCPGRWIVEGSKGEVCLVHWLQCFSGYVIFVHFSLHLFYSLASHLCTDRGVMLVPKSITKVNSLWRRWIEVSKVQTKCSMHRHISGTRNKPWQQSKHWSSPSSLKLTRFFLEDSLILILKMGWRYSLLSNSPGWSSGKLDIFQVLCVQLLE
jgi:hypothetical protein